MYAHVPVKVPRLRKAQHANAALVRLLTAVYSHVLGQGRRIAERLLAHATSEENRGRLSALNGNHAT